MNQVVAIRREGAATPARFALLSHLGTDNLGDDIQALAARRFLPRVDLHLPREALDRDPGGAEPVALILNGWFMHAPEHWPPHPRLAPLITSFHLSDRRPRRWQLWRPTPARVLLSGAGLDWLRAHGPVGARDRATLDLLQRHDVESHYSGCLTLTLAPPPGAVRGGEIVACDLAPPLLAEIAARTGWPAVAVSHYCTRGLSLAARQAAAEMLLALYARARAVVTSRLHCVLPCLALGTPVLFIPAGGRDSREAPALELARHATAQAFLERRDGFDLDDPPANPDGYKPLAAALTARCTAFVAAFNPALPARADRPGPARAAGGEAAARGRPSSTG